MEYKVGVLFPGQGSQYLEMCKSLYDRCETVRKTFLEASEILDVDFVKLFVKEKSRLITKSDLVQPAVVTASIACYRTFLEKYHKLPSLGAGHSLGEYSALTASGCLTFEDTLRIVKKRGEFMHAYTETLRERPQGMIAVSGVSTEIIQEECDKEHSNYVFVANYNSPKQAVLSGELKAMEPIVTRLEKMGAVVVKLNLNGAFHSPFMKGVGQEMIQEIKRTQFHEFLFPVISNVTAKPHTLDKIQETLITQISGSVQWINTIHYIEDQGINCYIDMGPGTILKKLNGRFSDEIQKKTFSFEEDEKLLEVYLGQREDEKSLLDIIKTCYVTIVCTKNCKCYKKEEYEEKVIKPSQKIKETYLALKNNEITLTEDEVRAFIMLTNTVLIAKGIPEEERSMRFNTIMAKEKR